LPVRDRLDGVLYLVDERGVRGLRLVLPVPRERVVPFRSTPYDALVRGVYLRVFLAYVYLVLPVLLVPKLRTRVVLLSDL
jgi:hypothetical protein